MGGAGITTESVGERVGEWWRCRDDVLDTDDNDGLDEGCTDMSVSVK